MDAQEWYRTDEVASLLGLKPDSVAKRARRAETGPSSEMVRRVSSSTEGGRARVEIHHDLVTQWLDVDVDEVSGSPASLLRSELSRSRANHATAVELLHRSEIARRDDEIDRLREINMAREFEIAELRSRAERLGALVADLTKAH